MTAQGLRDIVVSSGFQHDLEELSAHLASIKQERAIVYLLAKQLWERGCIFQLEDKRKDLIIEKQHIEFKLHYDSDITQKLSREMKLYDGKPLTEMWDDARLKKISKSWCLMPSIYEDTLEKRADVFVWIIYARDLSKLPSEALDRICWATSREQRKHNAMYSYSDREFLTIADSFVDRLNAVRPFSRLQVEIEANRYFPSTYYFRICDFSQDMQSNNGN